MIEYQVALSLLPSAPGWRGRQRLCGSSAHRSGRALERGSERGLAFRCRIAKAVGRSEGKESGAGPVPEGERGNQSRLKWFLALSTNKGKNFLLDLSDRI